MDATDYLAERHLSNRVFDAVVGMIGTWRVVQRQNGSSEHLDDEQRQTDEAERVQEVDPKRDLADE